MNQDKAKSSKYNVSGKSVQALRVRFGLARMESSDVRFALESLDAKDFVKQCLQDQVFIERCLEERYFILECIGKKRQLVGETVRLAEYVAQALDERYWLEEAISQKNFILSSLDRRLGEQRAYVNFQAEVASFRERSAESVRTFTVADADILPQLNDRSEQTPFDRHYLYHPAWAARILAQTRPEEHVDIGSILQFATMLSAFVPTRYYDFRPATLALSGLSSGAADLTDLSFPDQSLSSLSCMHVIEHIGLGRYGDPIDPEGDLKAIRELVRVLAPNGDLLIATPVGKKRIQFNAHRIYDYREFASYFEPLKLVEFSLIEEGGDRGPIVDPPPELVDAQSYGCGCFWFKRVP